MTRHDRIRAVLRYVTAMDAWSWAYDAEVLAAAHAAYDTLKEIPDGPLFDAKVAVIRSLHAQTSRTFNVLTALGGALLGAAATSPLWTRSR